MKEFKLKQIKYKNLLAVGSESITIDLNVAHKTLITGVNGGGKSTIIEAITYALFGKPFRNIKLGQLVNAVNKKDLLVELLMEYNNDSYLIRRGQKPTVFEVIKNGVPLDATASSKDFQAHFEEMIGMNYNSYKQVVVLGTAGYTPFMGLGTPARRKLVEDLLEVTVLADMDKLNKDEVKRINSELSQVELQISHTKTQIQTLEAADERQKKLSGDNVDRLQKMLDSTIEEINAFKDKNFAINEEILTIQLPEDVSSELSDCNNKAAQANFSKNSITKVLGLYEKGGDCPTCMQKLSAGGKIIDELQRNKVGLETELASLETLKAELTERKAKLLDAKTSIQKLENQISTNTQLAKASAERARKVKAALAEAKKEFVDNTGEILGLNKSLNEFIEAKSSLVVEKHRRSLITEMLKDSGIKGAIIKKYIPLFNKQINHYLGLLEADYSFTLDEEFSETIKSRGRESFSYASFSQGEKGRIDLALMFTWRDIAERVSGIRISCLILDEVFDSCLDAAGIKNITTILNNMPETNVFIISHKDHNPSDYGQHIQMKKVGRFTIKA